MCGTSERAHLVAGETHCQQQRLSCGEATQMRILVLYVLSGAVATFHQNLPVLISFQTNYLGSIESHGRTRHDTAACVTTLMRHLDCCSLTELESTPHVSTGKLLLKSNDVVWWLHTIGSESRQAQPLTFVCASYWATNVSLTSQPLTTDAKCCF